MKNVKVVIGAGFGDEGKGLVTDYLSKDWADLVVRFNGGAQAAHTVKREGLEHVFGHFGSGTFNNVPTYLSSRFVVNPELFLKEWDLLEKKGITPTVYVNEHCFVTTFIDVMINQLTEKFRNKNRHGSCGVGFNETITRCLGKYSTTVGMLQNDFDDFMDTFLDIFAEWIEQRFEYLGVSEKFVEHQLGGIDFDTIMKRTVERMQEFLSKVTIVGQSDEFLLAAHDNVLFEGAQGLLLDEYHEYFPYVTRSRTGVYNVSKMLKGHNVESVELNYVTRAYTTRHGAGPFKREAELSYNIIDTTNVHNDFQGTLRFGHLDVDLLTETIKKDLRFYKNGCPATQRLIVTCMDQVGDTVTCYADNAEMEIPVGHFEEFIRDMFQNPVLLNGSAITPEKMEYL